jgi:iron complex outermembrane receptor protein
MHANTLEATLRGPVARLPAGDVQLAVGGTIRRDTGIFESGVTSLDARSESRALFAETSLPLVSPEQHLPGLYSAEADLAVRRDWFDTFGSQTSPQLGLTWRPVRSLLIRGSYGKAFKAPSLSDLYSSRFTGISEGIPDPLRGNEVSNFLLSYGGNPNVQPERAKAMTLGAIWEPGFLEGLSVGLTTFRIRHEDFITRFSDYQTMMLHPELFGDRIVRAAPTAEDIARGWPGRLLSLDASTLNYGGVEVRGSDLDLRYAFPRTRFGQFTWSLLGSYIDEYKVQLAPGAPASDMVGHANRAGYPTHFKGNMQLAWAGRGGFGAALTTRYTGPYIDYVDLNHVYHVLPSQTLWDAQLSYRDDGSGWLGLRGFRAELGVTNLTGSEGHFSNAFSGYDFQQADLRGRFFYLNLYQEF